MPKISQTRLGYIAILGVLENKTNATFLPNIGSLKSAIVEELNKNPKNLF